MHIADSILDLIGHTPLVRLARLSQEIPGCKAEVLAKLEYRNPGFSVKDRLAIAMVDDAESKGQLHPHAQPAGVIVEPTSGNTGIGLALVAAIRGYRLILTMPEHMSNERKVLLRGLGAELVLTPQAAGMAGAVAEAKRLAEQIPEAIILQQFSNGAGPLMHERTTAEEIWQDCDGEVDIVVAGIGTGGTVTGIAHRLKLHNPGIAVYGVEPAESAVLSGHAAGAHIIQGIGAGFVPEILDMSSLDGVIPVAGRDAVAMGKRLMDTEGIIGGISSGAAVCAAYSLACKEEHAGKRIVCIICDTGERYLSTALFSSPTT